MNEGINPAFDLIGLTQLRNDPQFAGIDGSGFSVAVIDTGIDYNHELLESNYVTGYDFYDEDSDPIDDNGHGTHVAGTVGANDETIGVAPDVGIIGLDVSSDDGSNISFLEINESLQWVLDNHEEHNIVSVNMSLGSSFYTSEEELVGHPTIELINRLEREGIVVVSGAGNSYAFKSDETINQTQNVAQPAIYSTLAVGAVWQDDAPGWNTAGQAGADRVTFFSQRLDADNFLFAPGAFIKSTSIDGGFESMAGTSMASPHVAGAVALLQEASLEFGDRRLTPDEVSEILRSTADTVVDGDNEQDNVENTGESFPRMNIYNAVAEVKRLSDGTAPPPDDNPEEPISSDQTIELFRFRNTTFDTGTYVFVGEGEKDAILEDENLSNTFSLEGKLEDGTVNSAFVASTTPGDDLIPFYRLKSLDISGTFLFVGEGEYDTIFASDSNQKDKWETEGLDADGEDIPEFYLYDGSADSGTTFNRFQNTQNGTFLYAGESETEAIESDPHLSGLFVNQGVAFNSLS